MAAQKQQPQKKTVQIPKDFPFQWRDLRLQLITEIIASCLRNSCSLSQTSGLLSHRFLPGQFFLASQMIAFEWKQETEWW